VPASRRSIVPADTIAGRALVAVIAIMTFLAALTLGAVVLIRATATEWQSDVAREVTIQIRPIPGRDIEADVKGPPTWPWRSPGSPACGLFKAGTARLSALARHGLAFDDLPVPRLVVVRIAPDAAPISPARQDARRPDPGASLDDHRGWMTGCAPWRGPPWRSASASW
jgi:cell division transport system permease protein